MKLHKVKNPFYPQIYRLVIPIVIQNLLTSLVNSADVVMLNYVGQEAISAVSLAAQYANILFTIYFGLGTGTTILCAQYYGKGDMKAIQLVEGIAMRFSVSISCGFGLAAFFIPEYMMRIFTMDAQLIAVGTSYLRCISVAYFCLGIIEMYLSVLRSIGRVTVSTVLNIMTFALNILLNAVFIFGLFGAPKLGAMGVAIATSISRVMELAACFFVSVRSKDVKVGLQYMFVHNKLLFRDYLRLALPALANDIVFGVAFSTYSAVLGHLGTDAVAANSFVTVVRNFGTILCFGMANAGGILLGQEIGENRLKTAWEDVKRVLNLTIISGLIGGLIVLCAMPVVMRYAKNSLTDTAMYYLKYMLLMNVYYVLGGSVNTSLISGVFRAGGDSRFGLICDILVMWCYAVPVVFFSAFVLKLPVLWVYFILCTDEFAKLPWVLKHYRSGKWLHNITRDDLYEEVKEF